MEAAMHDAQEVRKHVKSFKENDAIIKRGLATFVEVGRALADVRDREQYIDAGYDTFEQCCQKRYGMARQTAYDYIHAAEYVGGLDVRDSVQILNKNQALNAAKAERDEEARQKYIADLADQARAAGFAQKPKPTAPEVDFGKITEFYDEERAFPDLAATFVRLLPADVLKRAYLDAARQLHPDVGGSPKQMSELNHVWKRMQLVLKGEVI
jgi:hypothetical protein